MNEPPVDPAARRADQADHIAAPTTIPSGRAAGPTQPASRPTPTPPATSGAGPARNTPVPEAGRPPADDPRLTHVDAGGAARMVDVSGKEVGVRLAVAAGRLRTTVEVVELLRGAGLPKGDALAVARLAGIMGAKRTPDLIPLCHPIALHGVTVELEPGGETVEITATVRTADRTGVEMEALTAVAVAGLALVDMVKAVDPAAVIEDVRVLRKQGGKTGDWVRPGGVPR